MSVLNKIWQLKNNAFGDSLLKKLLKNRGLDDDTSIEHFFNPHPDRDFHDPFLMKDMERSVARIGTAIENKERIMIFGDYDVDGITACAILMRALTRLGAAVSYRLPHRIEDGYGLREKFIKEFKKLDVKVAITVDNGISCFGEVELANELGIDVIITDHHTIPEKIPRAYAILHPKLKDAGYPFTELTGAGVALKLAQALFTRWLENGIEADKAVRELLDLACMGTIADLGPLNGENRYIVKEGLAALENTRWPGLSRLKEFAGVNGKVSTHAIGFLLGPRINAAGRISHPSDALKLLLHDANHASELAEKLEHLNQKRQRMMEELMEIADEMAMAQAADPILILWHPKFHGGVIGLIAAKLSEKFFRPAIVMEERAENLVGSCRSIPSVNIVEALTKAKDLLSHFGGHAAAAGFDIQKKNLPDFVERLKKVVGAELKTEQCRPILPVDCEIAHADVSEKTIEMLRWFEPFGMGNDVPRFLCKNVLVEQYTTVGADKKHLKITGRLGGSSTGQKIDCIGFRLGQFAPQLSINQPLDLICEIEENVWRDRKIIQLKILDFKVGA